ncbi:NB-ARC domain-containing protein [Acaryochloris sp. CCMEE 5410]|uniref:NB-ARC domain-containing protein n=1 Tax=Acaryochloris sp. CCMEE 5410 TaxID=310037 RepID=UPI0002D77DA8|nr:NB-ARC domain-containing protein [Acaryochloris sp. CCMEE 5410]KAI9132585.1 LuxR family transcriptional regulator [Acaryochloris sp. CCMEE 5410]
MIPPEFLSDLATQQGVSKSELAALKLGLAGYSTADIGEQLGISGDAARKRLSEVYQKFGIAGRGPVKLTKLQQLLVTRYQEALEKGTAVKAAEPEQVDWGNAPDVSVFYGRTAELEQLERWIIQDQYRLLALYGISGIGKTTLSVKLTQRLQPHFEKIFWRSLYYAPLLQDLLTELTTFLHGSPLDPALATVSEQMDWVLDYLQHHRCLVVLNGLESFSRKGDLAGSYQPNYENYSQLIHLVGTVPHQSCIVTTSQEKLSEVAYLEGQTLPVGSFKLRGLELEQAKAILQNKGLTGEDKWQYLVNGYRGNPMMLKLVAETIKEVFGGNVSDFLETSLFTRDIHNFIERIFDRVSDLERRILYILAEQSDGLGFKQLQAQFSSINAQDLMSALSSLRQRSLIEHVDQGFILPPVIKEVTQQIMVSEA